MSDDKNTDDFSWLRGGGADSQDDWPEQDDTPPGWDQTDDNQPDLLGDRLGFTDDLAWRGGESEAEPPAGPASGSGLTDQLPWMRRHTPEDDPDEEKPGDDDLAWLRGTEDDLLAGRVEPPAPPVLWSESESEAGAQAAPQPRVGLPSWLEDDEDVSAVEAVPAGAAPDEPEVVWEPSVAAEEPPDTSLPDWLLDEEEPDQAAPAGEIPLRDDTGALSQEWLRTGELLRDTVESDMTFDQWLAQQAEAERVPDIEEHLPEFGLDEAELPALDPAAVESGDLPDWFLGLDELDTSAAPDWFTGEAPLPAEPAPPEPERASLDEGFFDTGDPTEWFAEDAPAAAPVWLEDLEGASGANLPEPDLADLGVMEEVETAGVETAAPAASDDIDSLLARLGADEVILPAGVSAADDLDLDALLDEFDLEALPDFPPPGEPLLPPEAPDWLTEMGATVGGVSAAALVRQREDRPLAELPDRLRKLRVRGEAVLTRQPPADPSPLAELLPGVEELLPPAPIAPAAPSVAAGLLLTPDQRRRADLLRALAGAETAEPEDALAPVETGFLEDEDNLFETVYEGALPEQVVEAPAPVVAGRRARLKPARLLIALLVAAAVILPFFVPPLRIGQLPPAEFAVGSGARIVFDTLNRLRPGDLVLVGVEYGPTAAGELDSLTDALLRHILLRQARPVVVGANPVGVLRTDGILRDLGRANSPFLASLGRSAPLQPNNDYYIVRYLPAAVVGLRALAQNPAALVATDLRGQPTGLDDVKLVDFAAVALVGERAEDVRGWAEQVAPLTAAPLLLATGFSAAPLLEPYVGPAFAGLLVGFPDAVTYASLLASPGVRLSALEQTEEPEATEEPTPEPISTPTAAPTFTPTPALPSAVVFSTQSVNVRQGPGTEFAVITTAEPGAEVLVLAQSGDGLWSQIQLLNGVEGWVSSSLLRLRPGESVPAAPTLAFTDTPAATATPLPATDTPLPTATDTPAPTGAATSTATALATATPLFATTTPQPPQVMAVVVASQRVNVRSGPGTGFQPIGSLPPGTQVEVIGRSGDAGWIQVRLADGREGWISASLLRINAPQGSSRAPDEVVVVMADADIGSLLRQDAPPPAPAVPYAEERWYGMNLGLLVIVLIILLGAVLNTARGILRRRR
ncbi:MAG: SH3 domain-containing protein [Aggregatilineales bacterium]